MNKTMKKVDSNIDVETLKQLLKSGHLYTDVQLEDEVDYSELVEEALDYVGILRECVTPMYEQTIDQFWKKVLNTDWLLHHLPLESGKNRGGLNRNNIFVIVDYLYSNGVYKASSSLQLFYKLEGHKKTSIYTRKTCYIQYISPEILEMCENFAKFGEV